MSPKAFAVGSVCVLLACAGTDGRGASPGSPEAKLASIDLGTQNPPRAAVNAYAGHLDRLQVSCRESRSSLADITVDVVAELGRKGIQSTNREFLAALDGAVPDEPSSRHGYAVDVMTGKLYCTEAATMLLTVIMAQRSPEAMLAGIDLGTQNPPRATVNAYAAKLNRLQIKCRESPISLADITVESVEWLGREGIQSTNWEFLAAIDGAVPDNAVSMNCTDVAVTLVMLALR